MSSRQSGRIVRTVETHFQLQHSRQQLCGLRMLALPCKTPSEVSGAAPATRVLRSVRLRMARQNLPLERLGLDLTSGVEAGEAGRKVACTRLFPAQDKWTQGCLGYTPALFNVERSSSPSTRRFVSNSLR